VVSRYRNIWLVDFVRVLVRHQAGEIFHHGLGRQDRLLPLAGISGEQTVEPPGRAAQYARWGIACFSK